MNSRTMALTMTCKYISSKIQNCYKEKFMASSTLTAKLRFFCKSIFFSFIVLKMEPKLRRPCRHIHVCRKLNYVKKKSYKYKHRNESFCCMAISRRHRYRSKIKYKNNVSIYFDKFVSIQCRQIYSFFSTVGFIVKLG